MSNLLRLSYSGMSKYIDCPLQYKYMYIDKIYVVQDIRNQLVGLALHDVLNKWYEGGDFRKDLAMGSAREIFDGIVKKNKVIWRPYENAETMFATLRNQLDSSLDILAKENLIGKPLFTEFSFEENIGDLFTVSGRIDLYLDRGDDSVLLDYKTSKTKYYTKPDQLALYSYAIFKKFGKMAKRCGYFFTALGEIDWYNFKQDFYNKLFGKFKKVADSIQEGKFPPMPTKKGCGWCNYKDRCPFTVADSIKD